MGHRDLRRRLLAGFGPLLLGVCTIGLPARAQTTADAGPYRYTSPPGWTLSKEDGTELLELANEPGTAAQIMLLAPRPVSGDFDRQFAAERAQLEQLWGLRAPQSVAPQRGQSAQGAYAAYFASYDSGDGPRYMSFLASSNGQRLAMVVFVTDRPDVFNRLAPVATQLFKTLQFAR